MYFGFAPLKIAGCKCGRMLTPRSCFLTKYFSAADFSTAGNIRLRDERSGETVFKKRKKLRRIATRLISLMIALCMAVALMPVVPMRVKAVGTGIADELNKLKSEYPDENFWTVNGRSCPGIEGSAYHADDNHSNCLEYDLASECMGFARLLFHRVFGVKASGLESTARTDRENVSVGDYIRTDDNSHSAIVIGKDGDKLTIVECNYGYLIRCRIKWGREININKITYFIHAPQDVYDRVNGTEWDGQTPITYLGDDFYAVITMDNQSSEGFHYLETPSITSDSTELTYLRLSANENTLGNGVDPKNIWRFIKDGDQYKIVNEYNG